MTPEELVREFSSSLVESKARAAFERMTGTVLCTDTIGKWERTSFCCLRAGHDGAHSTSDADLYNPGVIWS